MCKRKIMCGVFKGTKLSLPSVFWKLLGWLSRSILLHFLIMPCFICTIRRCHLQGLQGAESIHRYLEHLCASWPSCRDYDEDFFFLMNMRSMFWDHCKILFYFGSCKIGSFSLGTSSKHKEMTDLRNMIWVWSITENLNKELKMTSPPPNTVSAPEKSS